MGKRLNKTNYFIEGLQGTGKSTFVQKLSEVLNDYKVFREGDYSPVELAWCAYVTEEQYTNILNAYSEIQADIKGKTFAEGNHRIICYTQILTDLPGFHRELEKYEIYNGRYEIDSFERIIFDRFKNWNGERQIFECSIFQNIIENQILYLMMSDEEIIDFYRRLKNILGDKPYKIIYLDMEDIADGIRVIRKERSDEKGNEFWFPLMLQYLEESPYGKAHVLAGEEGLFRHLEHRRVLEHRIIEEIFRENTIILKAKNYKMDNIITLL